MIIIMEQFDQINAQYEKMKWEKLIPCNCDECKIAETPYFYEYKVLKRRIEKGRPEVECERSFEKVNALYLIDDVIDKERFFRDIQKQGLTDENFQLNVIRHADQIIIQQGENMKNNKKRESSNYKLMDKRFILSVCICYNHLGIGIFSRKYLALHITHYHHRLYSHCTDYRSIAASSG